MFVELKNHSTDAFGELISYIAILSVQSFLNPRVSLALPVIETVNLVQGNDELTFSLLQEIQGLDLDKGEIYQQISATIQQLSKPTIAEKDSQGVEHGGRSYTGCEAKKQFVVPSPSLERSGHARTKQYRLHH